MGVESSTLKVIMSPVNRCVRMCDNGVDSNCEFSNCFKCDVHTHPDDDMSASPDSIVVEPKNPPSIKDPCRTVT